MSVPWRWRESKPSPWRLRLQAISGVVPQPLGHGGPNKLEVSNFITDVNMAKPILEFNQYKEVHEVKKDKRQTML